MIRVGLVGEDPNDTSSIKNLLDKKYKGRVQFTTLVKGITGNQLDSAKLKKTLPIEFASRNCRFVIYIRDLDEFQSNKSKLRAKTQWFEKLDAVVNGEGILLLNIWELEALILADIATFNKEYKIKHNFQGDPSFQKEPKELLMRITANCKKQYKESHSPNLFKKLHIEEIEKRCAGFSAFIGQLNSKL